MQRILVTGGAGELGRALTPLLLGQGWRVRGLGRRAQAPHPASEWAQADLASGAGLDAALAGVDVVIHAASSPSARTREVDVDGTARLLAAARAAGVGHLVYISIVGCDRIPFAYYRAKAAAEALVQEGQVPWSILRATQFHALIDGLLGRLDRLPLLLVPARLQFQPIDTGEVAARLAELAIAPPAGRLPDIGGPEVLRLGDMARQWLAARGRSRRIAPIPALGRFASALREGYSTCPEQRYGRITWAQWLRST